MINNEQYEHQGILDKIKALGTVERFELVCKVLASMLPEWAAFRVYTKEVLKNMATEVYGR